MVLQDPFHRVPGNLVTQVGKRGLEPRVAPLRILARPSAPPSRRSLGRVVGRPRHLRGLPSYFWAINLRYQRRIVSGVTIRATCINARRPRAEHCEPTALGVCEPKRSPTTSLAEDAILRSEIVDQILDGGSPKRTHSLSGSSARCVASVSTGAIVLNERHLRCVLREWVGHYTQARPRTSLAWYSRHTARQAGRSAQIKCARANAGV